MDRRSRAPSCGDPRQADEKDHIGGVVSGLAPPARSTSAPQPDEDTSALFQVVPQRHSKTSIAITTNRGVGAWGDIHGDSTVAGAKALYPVFFSATAARRPSDRSSAVSSLNRSSWFSLNSVRSLASTASRSSSSRRKLR